MMPDMPDDPLILVTLGKIAAAACVAIFIYGAALGVGVLIAL
jgi:hypothetical protein